MYAFRLYFTGILSLGLKLISIIPSHFVRNFLYKIIYRLRLGKKVTIYGGVEFRSPWRVYINHNSIIGHNCLLDGRKGLFIGKNVNISSGAWIWTLQHDVNDPSFKAVGKSVHIGDYAWICSRSIILPGVEIGEGAVVAAGSVVTKSIPPYSIAGGVPAKIIGKRSENLQYTLEHRIPFI